MATIDLETGKTSGKSEEKKSTPKRSTSTVKERVEKELDSRLDAVFLRIANTLESRGDEELSSAIREDRKALAGGLMSLTRNFPFLRNPFILLLNLAEFLLAFGRVGGILMRRFLERRERVAQARAQAQAEWEASQNPAYATGTPVQ